ncbi:MerR family transcriptional regulator [Actinoplanes couchii]|uniref:MerR family transcriptional regulator n=1 Tax=Actinoplanes couchii TaxID=403638 RepID=A0ABQ3XQM7_9ACTN|nr:MerR family transcriptional regulator [Actinoplanes couchii]MDR6318795.1 DNA-binding transcriptional MerR regulator [Actinoplanes couchii]GID60826.1 MerR family transcriptional regulator [Actinoplanes couchii]
MRIGELANRTGASRRLLRYYEEQGLIVSQRCANGYRSYDDRLADRVLQIRGLLEAGLPIRVIKQVLPCLDKPRAIVFSDATPEILETLSEEVDRMQRRIDVLTRNRDAVTEYLGEVRSRAAVTDLDRTF